MRARREQQSGQVMVLVAVALLALIGSAALILLAGSIEWQKNQLQELADSTALDSALTIGISCDAAKANAVLLRADTFLGTRRTKTGPYLVTAGTCATPYKGTDNFAGGLSATYNYPYRANQQQVEVSLTLTLPISFGGELGTTNTFVTRRAVAQALPASVPAVSATSLTCGGGQVNVGGDVMAQNAIAITGTCALYAHAGFDAASGTYSSKGNVRVYADGQSWVGGGGACTAGSNSGSSTAVCADGSEVSGHVAPACGTTGTSQLLSAGDATINPNPCAAGVAPQPVFPRGTGLPPDPNTDAAAIATLPGGVACNPAGIYPNLVVGGSTVGTAEAGTPAPVADASGFYHFKPSCYGYLNPGALSGAATITKVQTGPEVAVATGDVTPSLPGATSSGDLLVATIAGTPGSAVSAPVNTPGWTLAARTNVGAPVGSVEIWYRANSTAGEASPNFTSTNTNIDVQESEWAGVATAAPLDQTGTKTQAAAVNSTTISTSAPTTAAGDLGITDFQVSSGTFTSGGGWSTLIHDAVRGYASDSQLALPVSTVSESMGLSQTSLWADAIATFKPAGGASGGAVFDPGFYYFNGSGFAGGGGVCLNGGTLLARDVTLEFVNQAGFSSGTCAAGGGGGCGAGACRFGSTPCSISICPPNTVSDAVTAGGNTWFAAPCSAAPPAAGTADPSCPGSAWCPVGDRACWNLLVWAPATNTGQVAITGAVAKAWLLGSVQWPGTCTYAINGSSTIDGSLACGTLSISAGAGAGIGVGSDFGISTATVEAILIE